MSRLKDHIRNNIEGAKVSILGIGRKGVAAARLAHSRGARVFLSEARPECELEPHLDTVREHGWEWEAGGHSSRVLDADLIVRSSGVLPGLPVLRCARTPIFDELDFASAFVDNRVIAATGTNGKTLTLSMFGNILQATGRSALKAGGSGALLSELLTATTARIEADAWLLVEVSAVQLDGGVSVLAPHIGCVTSIAEDHMDRFRNMRDYVLAKAGLFRHQKPSDHLVVSRDCSHSEQIGMQSHSRVIWTSMRADIIDGIMVDGDEVQWRQDGGTERVFSLRELQIPSHHVQPAICATALAKVSGISSSLIGSELGAFRGVAHRYEVLGEADGVLVINDSKANNPAAAVAAIGATKRPMILLMGGRSKVADMRAVAEAIAASDVEGVVCYGSGGRLILDAISRPGLSCFFHDSFAAAATHAFALASPGQALLLAPACTAGKGFASAEERGALFRSMAREHFACFQSTIPPPPQVREPTRA